MFKKIFLFFCLSTSAFANLPYYPIQFPRDEAAHFDNVPYSVHNMTEWWYYNGRLTATNGRNLGYYISYFIMQLDFYGKKILLPRFEIQITDIDRQKVFANSLLIPIDKTNFSNEKLNLTLGDVSLARVADTYELNGTVNSTKGEKIRFVLKLTPERPPLLIGKNGLIDMWLDWNSYYYSQTHLRSSGYFKINNEYFYLDTEKSLSWMDHQWGDFLVIPGKIQWIWSSVQLENGLEINLGTILDPKSKKPLRGSATIYLPEGTKVYTEDLKVIPRIDPRYKHPLHYDISIPEINLQLTLDSLVPNQDMNGISEGVSAAVGIFKGQPVKGHAYAESTVFY